MNHFSYVAKRYKPIMAYLLAFFLFIGAMPIGVLA
jgi:hypothetical protein